MPAEQDKLTSKVEQAEAAVTRAKNLYEEAQPGSAKYSYLQLLRAKKASLLANEKALEQWMEKDLLHAAAGVVDNYCLSLSLVCGLRVCC